MKFPIHLDCVSESTELLALLAAVLCDDVAGIIARHIYTYAVPEPPADEPLPADFDPDLPPVSILLTRQEFIEQLSARPRYRLRELVAEHCDWCNGAAFACSDDNAMRAALAQAAEDSEFFDSDSDEAMFTDAWQVKLRAIRRICLPDCVALITDATVRPYNCSGGMVYGLACYAPTRMARTEFHRVARKVLRQLHGEPPSRLDIAEDSLWGADAE